MDLSGLLRTSPDLPGSGFGIEQIKAMINNGATSHFSDLRTDEGLIIFARGYMAIYASDAVRRILGFPGDLPMGEILDHLNGVNGIRELRTLDGRTIDADEYPAALGFSGKLCTRELVTKAPGTEEEIFLSVTVIPMMGDDGVAAVVAVLRDIGHRIAKMEEREIVLKTLEDERTLRKAVFEQMQTAVLVVKPPDGDVEFESITKKGYVWPIKLYRTNGAEYADSEIPSNRVLRTGKPIVNEEGLMESQGGTRVPVSLSANPVFSPDGRLWAVVMLVRDITRTYNHRHELAEALRSKDRFLSLAAHELKTPLTVLMANVQFFSIAEAEMQPDRKKNLLNSLVVQCNKVNRLVNDLLDMSRLSTGNLSIFPERQLLGPLVKSVVEEHAKTIRTHNFIFTDSEEPCPVEMDGSRIEQVLYNLLGNACRYSPEGSMVRISMKRCIDSACILVEDEGIGIPEKDVPKVFDLYFRSEGARADKPSGLGLGLYVSKQVIQLHHGDIHVHSKLGAGTLFEVCLPLVK